LNLKVSEKSKWRSKSDKDFSQYSIPGISHHDVLVSSVSVVPPRSRPKFYEFRNFKGINVEQLIQAASEIYWGPFYSLDHVDDKVEFFNDVILALYNRNCSVTILRLNSEPKPWITPGLLEVFKQRDLAHEYSNFIQELDKSGFFY
jgi:hypothetical protein